MLSGPTCSGYFPSLARKSSNISYLHHNGGWLCFYDTTILQLDVLKIYNRKLSSIMVTFSKIMTERLLLRALKGGSNTKIITLNGKKIRKMPSALEKLPGLRTLDLQNNLISKVCPELSTLTQLTLLNLGNNLLEEVPEEIKYLTSLKRLHLFGNRICRIATGVCDGLQELIMLNLNNNQLTSLPQEVGRLRNLTYLSINHNQLTMIPTEVCSLENLYELHLNYNQLMYIPEEIKLLQNLRHLFLVRNNIEVLPEGLCHLKKLKLLDIAGNVIQIFPAGFQELKLREFYCEGNPLFVKQPITAKLPKVIWTLQEITARFVLHQLQENNQLIMYSLEYYPEIKHKISKAKKCVLCGKPFLSEWLECVQFVPPSKELISESAEFCSEYFLKSEEANDKASIWDCHALQDV
ncbi:leucine-rich repeat-containing protein 69 isoform X2 [Mesocricetus auratus]|uniref:Leucine-rich repeat-containing protein 69 isoform X2 n=1 Tax=Mesocricetus auratus TaxID=10036 RepID=A0ABM2X863_MESAU|nr:leucine-rich repeat-containing protein 69 isoform X2 [Mesocricetus auratus]